MGFFDELQDFVEDPVEGLRDFWRKFDDEIFEPITDWLKEETGLDNVENAQEFLLNKQSANAFLPVVYGERRIGGVRTYMGVTGSNKQYLHLVLALCEGEVEEIGDVYLDDVISTDSKFDGKLLIGKSLGTPDGQAPGELVLSVPGYSDNHRLKGVAFVYVRLLHDPEVFRGIPDITCVVKGRKVLDIRDDTVKYSTNPVLCLHDYLTNPIFGRDLDEGLLDEQSFIDAADFCDSTMEAYAGGPTISAFSLNVILDTSRKVWDNTNTILKNFNGKLPWVAGLYTVVVERDEPTVFAFDEDNIHGSWSFNGSSMRESYNHVKASFTNPDLNWRSDLVVSDSDVYLEEDDDFVRGQNIQLIGETNPYRALGRAETHLKRSRINTGVGFSADLSALGVPPGALVTVSHRTPGWSNKEFRVLRRVISEYGMIAFTLIEHFPETFDREVPPEEFLPPPDSDLPDARNVRPPSGLYVQSGNDHLVEASDGTVHSMMMLGWQSADDIYVVRYNIEYKLASETAYTPHTPVYNRESNHSFIFPVKDKALYNIRIRSVNQLGFVSDWVEVSHTVIGKTEPPPPPTNFLVNVLGDGTRRFSWINPDVKDLKGVEIRAAEGTGLTWGIELTEDTKLHEGLLTLSPWETNELTEGLYTFAIKSKDTSGNYCDEAVYIQSNLPDPRLGDLLMFINVSGSGWPNSQLLNASVEDGNLVVSNSGEFSDLPDTWNDWDSYIVEPYSNITFVSESLDLGASINRTITVDVESESPVTITEQVSDDGVSWSVFSPLGTYTKSRYTRVRLYSSDTTKPIIISKFYIKVNGESLSESTGLLDASTLPEENGGVRVPLAKNYSMIVNVAVSMQNTGPGWSWEVIDVNPTGPLIRFYNSSNQAAFPMFMATISGV